MSFKVNITYIQHKEIPGHHRVADSIKNKHGNPIVFFAEDITSGSSGMDGSYFSYTVNYLAAQHLGQLYSDANKSSVDKLLLKDAPKSTDKAQIKDLENYVFAFWVFRYGSSSKPPMTDFKDAAQLDYHFNLYEKDPFLDAEAHYINFKLWGPGEHGVWLDARDLNGYDKEYFGYMPDDFVESAQTGKLKDRVRLNPLDPTGPANLKEQANQGEIRWNEKYFFDPAVPPKEVTVIPKTMIERKLTVSNPLIKEAELELDFVGWTALTNRGGSTKEDSPVVDKTRYSPNTKAPTIMAFGGPPDRNGDDMGGNIVFATAFYRSRMHAVKEGEIIINDHRIDMPIAKGRPGHENERPPRIAPGAINVRLDKPNEGK